MTKKLVSCAAFLALLLVGLTPSSSVAAITANVIANAGSGTYRTPSNSALSSGSLLRFGTLNITSYNALSTSQKNDFATVNALFTQLGTTTANASGEFLATGMTISPLPGGVNIGDQVYTWVFNTNSTSTATAWGIFTSNTSSLWKIPNDPGSVTMSNNTTGGLDVIRGSSLGSNNYALAAIPEPASGMLVAAGMAVLAFRRRRPCA